MTVRLAPERGPDAGRRPDRLHRSTCSTTPRPGAARCTSSARSRNRRRSATLWDESERAGPLDGGERRHRRHRRHGAHQHPRLCRARCSGRGAPAARVASLPLPARGMAPHVYVDQLTRFCAAAGAARAPAGSGARARCSTTRRCRCTRSTRRSRVVPPSSLDGERRARAVHVGQRRHAEGHLPDARRGRRARRGDPRAARAGRRRRLVLVASAVARHGPDRPAAVAARRGARRDSVITRSR